MEQTRKPPYSRRQLQSFLAELDKELARISNEKHTLIVGGGYVMSHQVYLRRTNDVDVISDGLTPVVAQAARTVAMSLGIVANWINAAARGTQIPVEQELAPIFEGSVLSVLSPGLRYVLAAKLRAARDKDFNDCVALIQQLQISNEAEVQELLAQACGHPGNLTDERQEFANRVFARSRKRRLLGRILQRRRSRRSERSVPRPRKRTSLKCTPPATRDICGATTKSGGKCGQAAPAIGKKCAAGHRRRR